MNKYINIIIVTLREGPALRFTLRKLAAEPLCHMFFILNHVTQGLSCRVSVKVY